MVASYMLSHMLQADVQSEETRALAAEGMIVTLEQQVRDIRAERDASVNGLRTRRCMA